MHNVRKDIIQSQEDKPTNGMLNKEQSMLKANILDALLIRHGKQLTTTLIQEIANDVLFHVGGGC